jgi:hypothetical protein
MDEKWIKLSGWALAVAALVVVFGAGFVTGRMLPAHHYEKFGSSTLFDTSTGHMCSYRGDQPAADPLAAIWGPPKNADGLPIVNPAKNADGYPIVKPADPNAGLGSAWTAPPPANPIPACNAL